VKPMGGLGGGMSLGNDGVVLSSSPVSALGSAALQVPTPPRGTDTHRAPRAAGPRPPAARIATPLTGGAQAMANLADPEPLDPSELTTRQPAVSTEMRAVGAPKEEDDDLPDQPTVAMRSPVGQQSDSDEPSLVGSVVAERYKVLRRLGEGGMGVVYEAVDDRLEKHVAVKVLRDDFARRQDVVARFTQEAKSAARIKHENVLDVTDYGQTKDGSFYIAMELLVGTDLADVLQAESTLAQERGVEVAVQVCRALQAAHQRKQGDVEEDRAPIQFTEDFLEVRRLHAVAQQFEQQHQGHGAGHRNEAQLHAQHLAQGHAQHRQQEPAHHDRGEELVGNARLDAQGFQVHRLARPAPKAIGIHRRQRDHKGDHEDGE